MTEQARAKINLLLNITQKFENGYHGIETVMHTVSLCDYLSFEKSDVLRFECDKKELENADNLCVRAALSFFEKSKITGRAKIHLQKNIPVCAGLGGGSADAAACLRGLNRLYGNPLSTEELCEIAAGLGSDIPFCVVGKTAYCTGRGEQITPLNDVFFNFVIAKANNGIATKEAYDAFDKCEKKIIYDKDSMLTAIKNGDRAGIISNIGNSFEPVCQELEPQIKALKARLYKLNAEKVCMSGSGSAVFGIFKDAISAQKASETLNAENIFAKAAFSE